MSDINTANAIVPVGTNPSTILPSSPFPTISIRPPAIPTEKDLAAMAADAKLAAWSGFVSSSIPLPTAGTSKDQAEYFIQRRTADAYFIMRMGYDLGIPPTTALRQIFAIDGKLACSSQLILALLLSKGFEVDFPDIATIKDSATVRIKRPGGVWKTYTYTVQMATDAGLWKNSKRPVWINYPREMLAWRALTTAAKFEGGDAILNLYSVEELRPDLNYNADGELINVTDLAKPAPKEEITITAPPSPEEPDPSQQNDEHPAEQPQSSASSNSSPNGGQPSGNHPANSYPERDAITWLFGYTRKQLKLGEEITDKDIAAWAGVTGDLFNASTKTGWGQFADWTAAGKAIKAGYDRWNAGEEQPHEDAVDLSIIIDPETESFYHYAELWNLQPTEAVSLAGKAPQTFKNISVAIDALRTAAIGNGLPMVASAIVTYDGRKMTFDTPVPCELYGREKLRALGAGWAHFCEGWQAGEAIGELPEPILLHWKRSNAGKLSVTAVERKYPLEDAATPPDGWTNKAADNDAPPWNTNDKPAESGEPEVITNDVPVKFTVVGQIVVIDGQKWSIKSRLKNAAGNLDMVFVNDDGEIKKLALHPDNTIPAVSDTPF